MNLKNKFRILRKQEGFTLVELIVVIAIIAVLGGVAVPAYSGYIEKADRAADAQLLADVNKAFAAACMMNGENNFGRNDVNAALSAGTFTYTAPFADSFNGFYEGGEFKVFEALMYNAKNGAFEEATATMMNIYNILKNTYGEEIATLMASNLGAMGAETLLTEVADVAGWAGQELEGLTGEPFWNAVYSYCGVTDQAGLEKYFADNGLEDEDSYNEFVSNAMALYAAQNSSNVTMDDVTKWFGKEADALKGEANGQTLGEASAIYALYMSYCDDKGVSFEGTPLQIMGKALEEGGNTNSDFSAWVTEYGEEELDAYVASMTMINGAIKNEDGTVNTDTSKTVLTDGFDNPEMIKLMESLMGN